MIKQILIPIVLVAVFIAAVGMFMKGSFGFVFPTPTPTVTTEPSKTVKVGSTNVNVEVANNFPLREKGLSGRSSLGAQDGMFFVFDSKNVYAQFWMKNMLIPLDMVWIAGGKVVKIDKNVPFPSPGTPDNALTIYSPNQPVDYVLEVNAGFCDRNNIQVGDSVDVSGAI